MDSKNDLKKIDYYTKLKHKYYDVALHSFVILFFLGCCGMLVTKGNAAAALLVMFGLGSSWTLMMYSSVMHDKYEKKLKVLIKGGQDGKK